MIFCTGNLMAQSNSILPFDTVSQKVIYSDIVNLDSTYQATTIYNIIKEWFSSDISKFSISGSEKGSATTDALWGTNKQSMATIDLSYKNEQPLKLDDPNNKKLIGRVVCKYFGSSYGCVRVVYLTFDIKTLIKDGKYKYEIANFTYSHYNPYNNAYKMTFGTFSDKGPCKSSGPIEELIGCTNCPEGLGKFFSFIDQQVKQLIADLNEFIIKSSIKENW
jgi:hypothetical protein